MDSNTFDVSSCRVGHEWRVNELLLERSEEALGDGVA
jgi:hypothetical protein